MRKEELLKLHCLFLILIAFSIAGCKMPWDNTESITPISGTTTNLDFLTYNNTTYKIKIEYPTDWKKEELQTTSRFTVDFQPPVSPLILSLNVEDLSTQTLKSLDEIKNFLVIELQKSKYRKIIISEQTTLVNYPAYKIIYLDNTEEWNKKIMTILTVKNNTLYSITYFTDENKYSVYLETIQKIINSFEIY